MRSPADFDRRRALARMGSLVLLLGSHQLAHGAAIVAVRIWPARAYTRVTIESDQALVARHQVIEAPHRLVVDIDGLELREPLRALVGKVRADDPYIAGVRVGQYQPRVVRLVFDLRQPTEPQQFTLAPVAAYQHRLVFDLYPVKEADPLLALLRDKEAAEASASQAVQDALGELIARIEQPQVAAVPPVAMAASAAAAASGAAAMAPMAQASAPPLVALAPPPPASQVFSTPSPPPPPPPLTAAERRRVDRLVIVAIDPGHGGEDPGAIGPTGLREKDVVLAIALQLRDRLNALPGLRVMMTRDGDYFVPLNERVRKARRVQADLFISIHADAFYRREARGASVYALSTRGASSTAASWMARRENSSDQVGGVNVAGVKDRQLLSAMLDMSTTAQIKDSLKLGREVLTKVGRVGRLHKRQVEQAGFAVLKAPDIPSILVETAFISNPEEEAKLRDPAFRRELVDAIASGVRSYFAKNPPLARQRPL